jgi:hypothetical protein
LHELLAQARAAVQPGSEELLGAWRMQIVLYTPGASAWLKRAVGVNGPELWEQGTPTGADIVALLKANPAALQDPRFAPLLAAVVDILQAAGIGASQRRVAGLIPEGTREAVAAQARGILQTLATWKRGGAYDFPPYLLAHWLEGVRRCVMELQALYRKPRTTLARFRAKYGAEADLLSNADLETGEPRTVAAKLLEKATGIPRKSWQAARDQFPGEMEAVELLTA